MPQPVFGHILRLMKKNILSACLKPLLPVIGICLLAGNTAAQNVSINNDGAAPDNSAILDVKSDSKGMLIPRMTTTQRIAITAPAAGLIVFDTNTGSFWYYSGGSWRNMNEGWSINGNSGTDPSTHFIGTTTYTPLIFKINNERAGFLHNINGNTSLGHLSLPFSATGGGNTALGNYSLSSNGAGERNTANGYGALTSNSTGNQNTAIGFDALYYNSSGNYNVALGHFALALNTTASGNTAVGTEALYLNTIGINNTAVGFRSMQRNTTGGDNTALGYQALFNNTTGIQNVASGLNALYNNTEGVSNNAAGFYSMVQNLTGNYNVAHGALSLYSNTTGSVNTAIGQAALLNSVTGYSNTAVGHDALVSNQTGSSNTALGAQANVSAGNLSNATVIGYGAVVDASNKVRIGNSAVTVIEGQVPFTTPSDGRFKFNVQEDVKGLDFILQLRPVTYQFDVKRFDAKGSANHASAPDSSYAEAAKIRRTGFIAQEVEKAAKASGYHFSGIIKPTSTNDHYGLSYESFVAPLVKGMQEQQVQIQKQQEQLDALKKENEQLKKMMLQIMAGKLAK